GRAPPPPRGRRPDRRRSLLPPAVLRPAEAPGTAADRGDRPCPCDPHKTGVPGAETVRGRHGRRPAVPGATPAIAGVPPDRARPRPTPAAKRKSAARRRFGVS